MWWGNDRRQGKRKPSVVQMLCKNGVKKNQVSEKIGHLTLAFVGHSSDIMVDPEVWDTKKECIKAMGRLLKRFELCR